MIFGELSMPIRDYRDFLLQKADDAAERAKLAEDLQVRAAWQRIETSYRMTATSVDVAVTANSRQPTEPSAKVYGILKESRF